MTTICEFVENRWFFTTESLIMVVFYNFLAYPYRNLEIDLSHYVQAVEFRFFLIS